MFARCRFVAAESVVLLQTYDAHKAACSVVITFKKVEALHCGVVHEFRCA